MRVSFSSVNLSFGAWGPLDWVGNGILNALVVVVQRFFDINGQIASVLQSQINDQLSNLNLPNNINPAILAAVEAAILVEAKVQQKPSPCFCVGNPWVSKQ